MITGCAIGSTGRRHYKSKGNGEIYRPPTENQLFSVITSYVRDRLIWL